MVQYERLCIIITFSATDISNINRSLVFIVQHFHNSRCCQHSSLFLLLFLCCYTTQCACRNTQRGATETCYLHTQTHTPVNNLKQQMGTVNTWQSVKSQMFFLSSKINQPNAFYLRKADHWIPLTVVWVHPCVQWWPFTFSPLPVWAGSRHSHCKGQHVYVKWQQWSV